MFLLRKKKPQLSEVSNLFFKMIFKEEMRILGEIGLKFFKIQYFLRQCILQVIINDLEISSDVWKNSNGSGKCFHMVNCSVKKHFRRKICHDARVWSQKQRIFQRVSQILNMNKKHYILSNTYSRYMLKQKSYTAFEPRNRG